MTDDLILLLARITYRVQRMIRASRGFQRHSDEQKRQGFWRETEEIASQFYGEPKLLNFHQVDAHLRFRRRFLQLQQRPLLPAGFFAAKSPYLPIFSTPNFAKRWKDKLAYLFFN